MSCLSSGGRLCLKGRGKENAKPRILLERPKKSKAGTKMKVAIVGCGYVGMAVARCWQAQGLDVLATTTRSDRTSELAAVADQVNVLAGTDTAQLRAALSDRQVALLCVGPKRGASYIDTYLKTAQTLANILPETDIQQLIYTSSYSVYGQHHGAWVTEMMSPAPNTEKGEILAATEQTLLSATSPRRQICVLRLGGIYGPGRTVEDIYGRVAGTTRPGKGAEYSNWIHLTDIVGAIDWARQQRLGGVYNLVQDEIPTVRALIGEVCDRQNLPPVHWDESQHSRRTRSVRVSNAKLKSSGYQFVHPTFWP